jgi:hypothetical protein
MDHLLVAGFDIGQKTAPSAALRERARRSKEKLNGVRFARNRSGTVRLPLHAPLLRA